MNEYVLLVVCVRVIRTPLKPVKLHKTHFATLARNAGLVSMCQSPALQRQIACVHHALSAPGVDRICRTCNSCTLTTAQQTLCQRSPMWKRLQMRLPFSCPQPGQQFKTREEQLQRAKSNKCGSGRCSCVATGIAGNSNPSGDGFPDDSRCTGPVAYNILV
ncbi:Hypothetical protein PHPALM_18448 [Phytophthora palmivora]|uniref:Uncharacterized protein n=1 Tax=Phytophthora palmivora TaxID=4796 RepID=A0A2P4XJQ6_9STRA|nr:Hypothetical protein PHPALM_18448 [Phytophthora palmivora]